MMNMYKFVFTIPKQHCRDETVNDCRAHVDYNLLDEFRKVATLELLEKTTWNLIDDNFVCNILVNVTDIKEGFDDFVKQFNLNENTVQFQVN